MPRVRINGKVIAFPDSMSREEIANAIASIDPATMQAGASPAPPLGSTIPADTELRPGRGPVKRGLDLLPGVAGALGALVGGVGGTVAGAGVGGPPGAIGGAAVGGAGGEALKQIAEHGITAVAPQFAREQAISPPESGMSAARDIGLAAAEQAAYDAAGHGVAAAASKAGGLLMQGALKSGSAEAATAIGERISATKSGLKKVLVKTRESAQTLRAMLRHADRTTGIQFHAPDLVDEIGRRLIPKVEDSVTRGSDWATISRYARRFVRDFGDKPLGFEELQRLKQNADAVSDPIWKKIDSGEAVSGRVKARALWFKEMGDHFRDLLERTVPPRVDAATGKLVTVAEQNAATQGYIKLAARTRKAVRPGRGIGAHLAQRGAGIGAGAAVGASVGAATGRTPGERLTRGAEGAIAGGVAGSPAVLSLASLAMTHPMLAALLSNTFRAGGAVAKQAAE